MHKLITSLALVASSIAVCTAEPSSKITQQGYEISTLEVPRNAFPQQSIMLFLPATNNFTANVNVQIQPYDGKIEKYLELTNDQFKSINAKVITSKISNGTITLEYIATMHGRVLHFYAKAFSQSGKVYLATATGLDSEWETQSTTLKKCVDSIKPVPLAK